MKEIATVMSDQEFQKFLKEFRDQVDLKSLSYISRRCQIIDAVCALGKDKVFTVDQLKEIFSLAK